MSAWGLKDNTVLTGNVTTSNTSPIVQGFGGTLFLVEVDAGDYVAIAGNKYQVHNVTSNIAMTLTANAAAISANVKAYMQLGPKFIANVDPIENVYTIQKVVGLDLDEALVPSSRAKNLKTQGWNHYQTYTDAHGQTRHKAEVLVALSKSFTSSNAGDYADDATVLDQFIYFDLQPVDQVKAANANATLQVAVLSLPVGASPSYQWQSSPNNIIYANVTNTGVFTGATTNTLQVSNVANLDGQFYKLIASGAGLDSITSNIVTIEHL